MTNILEGLIWLLAEPIIQLVAEHWPTKEEVDEYDKADE